MKTSKHFLSIARPEDLFPGTPEAAKDHYKTLAKHWHPDVCKEEKATEVFQHIKTLYEEALHKFETNTWQGKSLVTFFIKNSPKSVALNVLTSRKFDLGIYYVGETFVTYILDKEHEDLFQNAKIRVHFKYASPNMEKEMVKYLPVKTSFFELRDGRFGMTVFKSQEYLLLRDVLAYYKHMDPKHIAWIGSTLQNLACYLNYAGVTHNEISLDTYFINPKDHSGALLGGWFYSVPAGGKIEKVSSRTYGLLPFDVKIKKQASRKTDLELIRGVGRELAGDQFNALPKPMQAHLIGIASQGALEDYSEWRKALEESFGKRTFTPMDLDSNILYRSH